MIGMPCEVNSILKLTLEQGYPDLLNLVLDYKGEKKGYRILPVDIPLFLVDASWNANAEIIINKLIWEDSKTIVYFKIIKVFDEAISLK